MNELDEAVMNSLKRLGFLPEGHFEEPNSPNYTMSCETWGGLGKVVEECGELVAVLGKVIVNHGSAKYWDDSNLEEKVVEEVSDVLGSIAFFMQESELDADKIFARANEKHEKFRFWKEKGE